MSATRGHARGSGSCSRRVTVVAWSLGVALVISLVPALVGLELEAAARPGGGQTYSGGSSSSSSGGGGEIELLFFLIRLCIDYPALGIPLLVLVVGHMIYKARQRAPAEWDSAEATAAPRRSSDLMQLLELDTHFSPIVFQDFVYRLYASAHQARRSEAALAALAPYLTAQVRAELRAREPSGVAVSNVVIGAMRVVRVNIPSREILEGAGRGELEVDPQVTVRLAFEANMSTAEQTYYVEEIWTLRRSASARSRPPDKVDVLGCPSCGAPFTSSDSQRCDYCGEVVEEGRLDWQVCAINLVRQERRPPALTGHVAERGTSLPTVSDPDVQRAWRSLASDDPSLSPEGLCDRVRMIFDALNAGWSALEPERLRPFVSDGMFDYLRYWLDAYRERGLRNIVKDAKLPRITFVKVRRDRYYHAVTVRIFASGKDFTVDRVGKVVAGSKSRPRSYSEYWTLIRGAGVRGAARTDARCPQCGAGLQVSMAGACEHCGTHITRGEFDWVLSKIEQDESYSG